MVRMTDQLTRAGYTFTPTTDPTAKEPGPMHVAKGPQTTTVQPDFLDGRDDDTELGAFLDTLFAHMPGAPEPTP
jgi:hypothetical protein